MKIEWNKVTWYSKLIAVVVFVVVFCVGFNLGKQSEEVNSIVVPAHSVNKPTTSNADLGKPINTVSYSCDQNKTIVASFYQGAR